MFVVGFAVMENSPVEAPAAAAGVAPKRPVGAGVAVVVVAPNKLPAAGAGVTVAFVLGGGFKLNVGSEGVPEDVVGCELPPRPLNIGDCPRAVVVDSGSNMDLRFADGSEGTLVSRFRLPSKLELPVPLGWLKNDMTL